MRCVRAGHSATGRWDVVPICTSRLHGLFHRIHRCRAIRQAPGGAGRVPHGPSSLDRSQAPSLTLILRLWVRRSSVYSRVSRGSITGTTGSYRGNPQVHDLKRRNGILAESCDAVCAVLRRVCARDGTVRRKRCYVRLLGRPAIASKTCLYTKGYARSVRDVTPRLGALKSA